MARRGPKSQAPERKKAKGETRPSREIVNVIDFPTEAKVPEPPHALNEYGTELWETVAPLLFEQRILTVVDKFALWHLCDLYGEIVEDRLNGFEVSASACTQLRLWFSEFGLTPASRGRVVPNGPGDKPNPFSRHGKKLPATA